jgi:hypothetical protein
MDKQTPTKKIKILELFCGTKSFSKVAESLGYEIYTMDNNKSLNPDLCINILDLKLKMIPFQPDIIWASPPCQCFSVASIGSNWKGNYEPKREETKIAIEIVKKTLKIIKELKPKYWIIENPRGVLRKMNFMKDLPRTSVCYCQYGDTRMKPTDLWNNFNFKGLMCKNGNPDHISAPRGSKTGTQGLKGAKERGIIPERLCLEIIKKIEAVEGEYK